MRKSHLFPIFLVYFLDNISFAVVFPLFSTLILTAQFNIVPFSEDLSIRTAMLGALNASFPLALLIGAPIMGDLSDHFGRKKTFLITVAATTLGNLVTGIAIYSQNYLLLIVSRFFCGFFSGNLTLCFAAISDLSPNAKIRAKNFGNLTAVGGVGWITAIGGLSWILAMIGGGNLSLRSPSLPFWIVSAIGLFNLIILYILFPETHPVRQRLNFRLSPIFNQIIDAFRTHHLRPLFLVQFFFIFGWLFIFQWFAGYSTAHYGQPRNVTSISLTLIGLCWIFGAAVLNRYLVRYIPLKKIPLYGLILLTLLLLATSYFPRYSILIALDCLTALIVSFTSANLFNLISLTARESIQGKVMGLGQSVITAAQFAAPLVGSFTPIQNIPLLYRIAALSTMLAFVLYRSTHTR